MHEHRRDGAEVLLLRADAAIPNNPRLPVLLHRGAVAAGAPEAAEALLRRHGWRPAWRGGIHGWHHYHSNAHEALAVVAGHVRVQLGGETGVTIDLTAGDVVVRRPAAGLETSAPTLEGRLGAQGVALFKAPGGRVRTKALVPAGRSPRPFTPVPRPRQLKGDPAPPFRL
jgi:mannose-6-phosphate isomerase-like protein (cupin superfamily)